ncbi:NUDIX domain-containing protein [Dietzia timorensis]|uniref:NUDIX domain-containing protein n=1 Tax=Dietzia timorensis TaxID=499555 RepID=UPI003AAD8743
MRDSRPTSRTRLPRTPQHSYDRHIASVAGYTTPRIDVRAGIFDNDGRILLVREIADHDRWTIPGGWCDVLESPTEAIEREVLEEAGIHARARQLAALIDREKWPHHPPYDRHIYKLLFVCESAELVDFGF